MPGRVLFAGKRGEQAVSAERQHEGLATRQGDAAAGARREASSHGVGPSRRGQPSRAWQCVAGRSLPPVLAAARLVLGGSRHGEPGDRRGGAPRKCTWNSVGPWAQHPLPAVSTWEPSQRGCCRSVRAPRPRARAGCAGALRRPGNGASRARAAGSEWLRCWGPGGVRAPHISDL